ncbi:MAG: hypothetical protein JXA78_06710 [Anaerolineales bacterium]|nr:hypothetical protein [Anaerolineales bacterium]
MERLIVENHSAHVHHRDLLGQSSNAPARERRLEAASQLYRHLALKVASFLIACGVGLQARYHEPLHTAATRPNS